MSLISQHPIAPFSLISLSDCTLETKQSNHQDLIYPAYRYLHHPTHQLLTVREITLNQRHIDLYRRIGHQGGLKSLVIARKAHQRGYNHHQSSDNTSQYSSIQLKPNNVARNNSQQPPIRQQAIFGYHNATLGIQNQYYYENQSQSQPPNPKKHLNNQSWIKNTPPNINNNKPNKKINPNYEAPPTYQAGEILKKKKNEAKRLISNNSPSQNTSFGLMTSQIKLHEGDSNYNMEPYVDFLSEQDEKYSQNSLNRQHASQSQQSLIYQQNKLHQSKKTNKQTKNKKQNNFQKYFPWECSLLIYSNACFCTLEDMVFRRRQESRPFSKEEVTNFLTQLVANLESYQRKGLSHRDIKPQNILYEGGKLQLSNFDSAILDCQGPLKLTSINYSSPEFILNFCKCKSKVFCPYKLDVYALGLTLLFICSLGKLNLNDRSAYLSESQSCHYSFICEQRRLYIKHQPQYHHLNLITKLMLEDDEYKRDDFITLLKKTEILLAWKPNSSIRPCKSIQSYSFLSSSPEITRRLRSRRQGPSRRQQNTVNYLLLLSFIGLFIFFIF